MDVRLWALAMLRTAASIGILQDLTATHLLELFNLPKARKWRPSDHNNSQAFSMVAVPCEEWGNRSHLQVDTLYRTFVGGK